MKKDFEFLTGLVQDFFAKKSIKDTLSTISEFEISGWEKWIQIEFAKFCKSHEDITEWGRELRYELDRRLSKDKSSCAIDFLIKQKHKHSPLALEIKQQRSPSGCIKAMLRDVEKLRKIKYSQDDLRGVWCVGVHGLEAPETVKRLVTFHSDERGLAIHPSYVFSTQIGKTGFSVTVF